MPDSDARSISETAGLTGPSAHTLRYYERIGLLDTVSRGPDGRRRFRNADLAWLSFLTRLRTTGMSIRGMQRFAELRRIGDSTAPARLELLRQHRNVVRRRISELTDCVQTLDAKIAHYEAMTTPAVAPKNASASAESPLRPAANSIA
jgi:DNA-binding transcriptional MerR regulator